MQSALETERSAKTSAQLKLRQLTEAHDYLKRYSRGCCACIARCRRCLWQHACPSNPSLSPCLLLLLWSLKDFSSFWLSSQIRSASSATAEDQRAALRVQQLEDDLRQAHDRLQTSSTLY